MKLEQPLLGLLAVQRMTGYDINKWLDTEGQFVGLDRHASQIYRELNKMQVAGIVDFEVEARAGVPDAKVYWLTEDGLARLRRWVRSPYVPSGRFQSPEFLFRLKATALFDRRLAVELIRTELDFRITQVLANRGRDIRVESDGAIPGLDIVAMRLVDAGLHRHGMAAVDLWIEKLQQLATELETAPTTPGLLPLAEETRR